MEDKEKITKEELIYALEHSDYDYNEAKEYMIELFEEAGVKFDDQRKEKFNAVIGAIVKKAILEMLKTYGEMKGIEIPKPPE